MTLLFVLYVVHIEHVDVGWREHLGSDLRRPFYKPPFILRARGTGTLFIWLNVEQMSFCTLCHVFI
jgi:hypothetical protein